MSTHDEYMTRRQARDLARRLARLERRQRSTAAAHADLRHSSVDGGVFKIKDADGNTAYELGTDPTTGVTAPQFKGGPVPEQPSAPFVDVGGEVVKIQHSGLDVEENPAPADFQRAQIHVAQDEVFEPSLSTLAGYLEEADGSFTHRLPGGEWYVGIVWETLSGKTSVMSDTVLADIPPLVDAQDIQDTLDEAQARLDEYNEEIAQPRFQALEDGLEQNTTNLTEARDRLTTAEQTLSPLPGRIETAEQDVAAAKEAAESAEARAVEASNNASNRLTNGGFELGLDHWTVSNVTLSSDAHTGNQSALIGVGGSLSSDASIPVSEGDIWDVSAYAKDGTELVIEMLDATTGTVLDSFTITTNGTWSETGRLRTEIPAGVDYMNIRITGDDTLVDDVVLRDVTDVVRLERAATLARERADQAIAELEVMRLAVDGEGGLRDRLGTAETVLEDKADSSALSELDAKLGRDLADIESHYSKIWRQSSPPPSGTHYTWLGEPHASVSVRLDSDGNETARNLVRNPSFQTGVVGWISNAPSFTNTQIFNDRMWDGYDGWAAYFEDHGTERYLSMLELSYTSIEPGQFLAVKSRVALERGLQMRLQIYWRTNAGVIYESLPWIAAPWYDGHLYDEVFQAPEGATGYRIHFQVDNQPLGRARLWVYKPHTAVADTEGAALAQVATYFDGDTESDRANDLWYNHDGVPHEWVNGTGWTPISDQRITELANTVSAHADRLQAAETTLGNKADQSELPELETRLNDAFNDATDTMLQAAQQAQQTAQQAIAKGRVQDTRNDNQPPSWYYTNYTRDTVVEFKSRGVIGVPGSSTGYVYMTTVVPWSDTSGGPVVQTATEGEDHVWTRRSLGDSGDNDTWSEWVDRAEEAAKTAYLHRLVVDDEIVTPEAIVQKLWADLGIFRELQATEGWIGGVNLADNAVTAEKMTITGDLAAAIVSADKARIAELISDEIWAALGVFDRLEAREGWIGGVNLADNAVTAEKVEASREMITRIMGAEWAYISERLVVEGDLIANHADVISAAIKKLSVTERADLFEAFITTLGAQEAVIDLLIGTEAWIGGTMLKDDTVTTQHIEFTETLVGNIAELLHLVVDRIDVNSLWADKTWQAAGHFGSEDADQKTEVDGTGVTLYRLIDGELIPAAQFGGGLTQLAFFDGNDSVGSIDQYGNAAFQELASNHLTVAGREVFPPNPAPDYEGYLFDALPRGIRDKAVADMAGQSYNREAYGFLEVSARVEAGREYRVRHTPFLMNTGEAYHGQYTYTFSADGAPSAPHTESDRIGTRWRIGGSVAEGAHTGGETVFTADQTGIMRILLNVRRNSGSGIHFHSSYLYADGITLTLEDIGPAKEYTGMRRTAAHGGGVPADRDNRPLVRGLTTQWRGSWTQTYAGVSGNASRFNRDLTNLIQGRNFNTGQYYADMIGGYQTTPGVGDDQGQTMQAALSGAELLAGRWIFTGVSQPFRQFGNTHFYWHAHNQPPTSLHIVNPPPNPMHDGVIGSHAGMTRGFQIPADMLAAIENGTFQGVTIHPTRSDGVRSTDPYHGIRGLGDGGLAIELTYQR